MTLSPKTLRILIGIYKWFYFILCLSFYFYQLPSFPLYTASEAVSNIHKILSINSFSDVFMFVDLHVDHKNSWIYSYRTGERIHGELLYISISNEDSQLVNFFTHIADCNICIAPISGSILDSDTSLHSTMAFSPLTNYDYDYFSFYHLPFLFIVQLLIILVKNRMVFVILLICPLTHLSSGCLYFSFWILWQRLQLELMHLFFIKCIRIWFISMVYTCLCCCRCS